MATEAFLRGCREKEAARAAMEKEPRSIHKALKYVKTSLANQCAIFGVRGSSYGQRQVTFSDQDYGVERDDAYEARLVSRSSSDTGGPAQSKSLSVGKEEFDQLKDMVGQLLKSHNNPPRSRSPTPPRRGTNQFSENIICFHCRNRGHLERNCPEKKAESFAESGSTERQKGQSPPRSPSRSGNM
jgi:hypothetical protein